MQMRKMNRVFENAGITQRRKPVKTRGLKPMTEDLKSEARNPKSRCFKQIQNCET
jgi:hypothetical protein